MIESMVSRLKPQSTYRIYVALKWILIIFPVLVYLPLIISSIVMEPLQVSTYENMNTPEFQRVMEERMSQTAPYFFTTFFLLFVILPVLIVFRVGMTRVLRRGSFYSRAGIQKFKDFYEGILKVSHSGKIRIFAHYQLAYVAYCCGDFDDSRQYLREMNLYYTPGQVTAAPGRAFKIPAKIASMLNPKRFFLMYRHGLLSGDVAEQDEAFVLLQNQYGVQGYILPLSLALRTIVRERQPHDYVDNWLAENGFELVEKQYFVAVNELNKGNRAGAHYLFNSIAPMDERLFFVTKAREYLTQES